VVRVRFAPSPTGSLHVGSALTAVANRRFADDRNGGLVLRIDDTDTARTEAESEAGIVRDLEWLGIRWDEGPVRQSERGDLYREAAERLLSAGHAFVDEGAVRFARETRPTLLRPDGRATYHLASVVDDADLGITHVIRGKDHLANAPLHAAVARALAAEPPEYLHHGLLVGEDGTKLSKRHGAASLADLRERGIPPEAVRRYLEELGLPRGDVHFDETRLGRLALEAIGALSDEELAARVGVDASVAPALRGAHDLVDARSLAAQVTDRPEPAPSPSPETLARFRELREQAPESLDERAARELLAQLRDGGGSLPALRLALTGAERGPELWALLVALPRDEALARAADLQR
jgi:tRNA synthetases class I (E and Q), catalytic domain